MDTSQKSFIQELQALDEPTKTKVLIVSTAILMVVVIYFWFAYFNGVVAAGGNQDLVSDQDQVPAVVQTSPQPDFWSRVGNGAAIVGQSIGDGIEQFGQTLENPKDYQIKPGN